jgi:TolB-like protein
LNVFTIVVVLIGVGFVVADWVMHRGDRHDAAAPAVAGASGEAGNASETNRAAAGAPDPGAALDGADSDDGLKSVAVLPFVNMSSDAENEYFSDGISEELLNVLVKLKGLRVASRTSAFSFKGKDVDIPTVAEALGVRHVVEGSVRRSGDQVRITAQLIDVDTDSHLWSDTYTRTMDDIFAIQDEIAQAIADALEVELLGNAGQVVATHTTDNVDAFEQYLLGRYYFNERTADSLAKSIELFSQVVAMDPEFAAAYSGLADAYLLVWQYGNFDAAEAIDRGRGYAEVAIALDPNMAEAHASLGLAQSQGPEPQGSLAAYDRALELNPNYSMAYIWKGNIQRILGDINGSLATFLAGERVDPLHPLYAENISDVLMQMGRIEEAEARIREAVDRLPDSWLVRTRLTNLLVDSGRLVEGYRRAQQDFADFPDSPNVLETLFELQVDLGNLESADSLIKHYQEVLPDNSYLGWAQLQQAWVAGNEAMVIGALTAALDTAPWFLGRELRRALALFATKRGEHELALSYLEPVDLNRAVNDRLAEFVAVKAYATAAVGNEEALQQLVESGLEMVRQLRDAGNHQPNLLEAEALIRALGGQIEEAEALVEESFQLGKRLRRPDDLALLLDRVLADSERYKQVRKAERADLARQKDEIESLAAG